MITWADVQAVALGDAKIQAVSAPQGAIFVTLAYGQMNTTIWGAQLDVGARYLAAHLFTIGSRTGGSGGPTSSEKAGDVSRNVDVKQDDTTWDSTPYGKEFRRLLRNLNTRWLVLGAPSVVPPFGFNRFIP